MFKSEGRLFYSVLSTSTIFMFKYIPCTSYGSLKWFSYLILFGTITTKNNQYVGRINKDRQDLKHRKCDLYIGAYPS